MQTFTAPLVKLRFPDRCARCGQPPTHSHAINRPIDWGEVFFETLGFLFVNMVVGLFVGLLTGGADFGTPVAFPPTKDRQRWTQVPSCARCFRAAREKFAATVAGLYALALGALGASLALRHGKLVPPAVAGATITAAALGLTALVAWSFAGLGALRRRCFPVWLAGHAIVPGPLRVTLGFADPSFAQDAAVLSEVTSVAEIEPRNAAPFRSAAQPRPYVPPQDRR